MLRPSHVPPASLPSLALALIVLVASGCDDRCVDACGIRNDCAVDDEVDCAGVCSSEQAQAEASSCSDAYDLWLDCRTGLDDLCVATGEECVVPQGEFDACVSAFCEANADDEICPAE